jgi:hypothetical protein
MKKYNKSEKKKPNFKINNNRQVYTMIYNLYLRISKMYDKKIKIIE